MYTQNISTLTIHRLTQAQYDRELAAGRIDENAIYLTPDESRDFSNYATIEQLNTKAEASHSHDDAYYTEAEIDTMISELNEVVSAKADVSHDHDGVYDEKGAATTAADAAIVAANTYTDNKITGLASTSYVDFAIDNIPAITNAEIDEICGASIYTASEVEV